MSVEFSYRSVPVELQIKEEDHPAVIVTTGKTKRMLQTEFGACSLSYC